MNANKAWVLGRDEYMRNRVLEEVLPEDCRIACRQGLLEIHGLHRYFDREVIIPDLAMYDSAIADSIRPLRWSGELLRWLDAAPAICLPHFDVDFPRAFPAASGPEVEALLRAIFDHLDLARPGGAIHLNIGATVDSSAARCAHGLLDFLDAGATRTNPFVILRIRDGVNLHSSDPLFSVTQRALDISRLRQGIAFSLMDSEMNCEWLESVSYTGDGLRMEPLHGDLFRGVRGTAVNGIVTVNVPTSSEPDWPLMQRALHLAGRILAQKLELLDAKNTTMAMPGTNVINIAGLHLGNGATRLGAFDMIEKINERVVQIERDFGLVLTVAAIESLEDVTGQPYANSGFALEAERQHHLRGGHSLIIPAAAHMSWQDLQLDLSAAHAAGVSFLRFSPNDIRCIGCHLPVAAPGPCPSCGSEARRRVDFVEGKLQSVVTGEPIF